MDWMERPLPGEVTVALPGRSLVECSTGPASNSGVWTMPAEIAGQQDPFVGWVSPTYGTWTPAAWLDADRPAGLTSWWAVADLESPSGHSSKGIG